jgi:serine/threonine protein kinase
MQPTPLGRYLLTERLALGGTAEIFKAKLVGIEGFEKTVVIKRILPHWSSNPHFVAMLIDEAKILVRLNHERIVQVYELGKEEETYYIVMEYIAGTDLRKLSEQAKKSGEPLTSSESLFILSEILKGLDYIHKQKDEQGRSLSIVHRDISPQNILISTEGAIKIADFGIAHAASRSYETATGILKGKFAYMSPEQARGNLLDQRTDLFAAGVILFELLSGRRLFGGGSDLEVLERVKNFEVGEIDREIRIEPRLKPILKKALHPQLKERYFNAHDFWRDLQEAALALKYRCDSEGLAHRLKKLTAPAGALEEKKAPGLQLGKTDLGSQEVPKLSQGSSIVSGAHWRPSPETEETRTLSEVSSIEGPRKPSLGWIRSGYLWAGIIGLAATLLGTHYYRSLNKGETFAKRAEIASSPAPFDDRIPVDETAQALKTPETQGDKPPSPEITPPQTAEDIRKGEESQNEKKSAEEKKKKEEKLKAEREKLATMKKTEEKPLNPEKAKDMRLEPGTPAKSGQGNLSVRASPWGRISISGVVSGSERPVSRNVSYGNYNVSVSYQNLAGEWKTVSRAVKVAKASTVCTAAFRPDGQGSISCN